MKRRRSGGQALIEVTLLFPWLVLSMVGAYDFGIAGYGLISAQSAARAVATYGSASTTLAQSPNATEACAIATGTLAYAYAISSSSNACPGSLLTYSYSSAGSAGLPSFTATVSYTVSLFSFPGIFPSTFVARRSAEMPIRN